jgi:hypothetical protein
MSAGTPHTSYSDVTSAKGLASQDLSPRRLSSHRQWQLLPPRLAQLADEIRSADVLREQISDVLADRQACLARRDVHGVPYFAWGPGL